VARNDRLRAEASKILVDAAIAAGTAVYVQPTVTFVYPRQGPVSKAKPIADVRRFFVKDPNGVVLNVAGHRGDAATP
jgi:hypothetical protein